MALTDQLNALATRVATEFKTRAPNKHAASHQGGGSDPLVDSVQTYSTAGAGTVAASSPDVWLCDTTSGNQTLSLPNTPTQGTRKTFLRLGSSGALTLNVAGGGTIFGAATAVLGNPYDSMTVEYTGTAGVWLITSRVQGLGNINVANLSLSGSLNINAAQSYSVQTRTAATNLATGSPVYNFCDATTAAFTVNLPATTQAGLLYFIAKSDTGANAITVAVTGGGLLNGPGSGSSTTLTLSGDFLMLMSTSTSGTYRIVGRGGTGQIVDAFSAQTVGGAKTFSSPAVMSGGLWLSNTPSSGTTGSLNTATRSLVNVDTSAGASTRTLPPAANNILLYLTKATSDANPLTIDAGSGGSILGVGQTIKLTNQGDYIAVVGSGTAGQWYALGTNVRIGERMPVTQHAGAATIALAEKFIELTAGTQTLPAAATATGQDYYLVNTTAAAISISGAATGETIGNTPTAAQNYSLPAGSTVHVASNGTKWRIL